MEPQAIGDDERTLGERYAWRMLGAPLYYCEHCLRKVRVHGDPPVVERYCGHAGARIIAPRRAIVAGEGGLNAINSARMTFWQMWSAAFGRTL